MRKIILPVCIAWLLTGTRVWAQEKLFATLVLGLNGTKIQGYINVNPGKEFDCTITITSESKTVEKSKGYKNTKIISNTGTYPASTFKFIIIDSTVHYPRSVYDRISKKSTCYLVRKMYGNNKLSLYVFNNEQGVASYFIEGDYGQFKNIDDPVFTGEEGNKEIDKLLPFCVYYYDKFNDKETGNILNSSMNIDQKLEVFKNLIDEFNKNCSD